MIIGASKGLVLLAPPEDNADARQTLAVMTSAIKPGTKVRALHDRC